MKQRSHYLPPSNKAPMREGLPVIIQRPALWSGAAGITGTHNKDTGLQLVRITGKNGEAFSTEVTPECLKLDHAKMLGV